MKKLNFKYQLHHYEIIKRLITFLNSKFSNCKSNSLQSLQSTPKTLFGHGKMDILQNKNNTEPHNHNNKYDYMEISLLSKNRIGNRMKKLD